MATLGRHKIQTFSDLEATGRRIGIVPEAKFQTTNIETPDQAPQADAQIDKKEPAVVFSVGPDVEGIEVGNRVLLSRHYQGGHYAIARELDTMDLEEEAIPEEWPEEVVGMIADESSVAAIKRGRS